MSAQPVSTTRSEQLGCVVDNYADGTHLCRTCKNVWCDPEDDEGEDE